MNSDKIRKNKNEKINLYNSNLDKNGNIYNQNRNIEDKFRNKTIVDNLEYDDSYDVDDIKSFRYFVANRKFFYILSIITFIVVCIVSCLYCSC